jgi:hypothetical protein
VIVESIALVRRRPAVRRRVSLVDWVGSEVVRRTPASAALAFDADFEAQGFRTVP